MSAPRDDVLVVPGSRLHYEVRGTGPLLLVLQGGDGDARHSGGLVRRLAGEFTVVTYDRRGLSRSTIDDPSRPVTVETHADDAHRLLAALTREPALLFGSSFGGLVGLALATRHPEQVATLVTHEPPVLGLLRGAARARARRVLKELEVVYRDEGWVAAFKTLAEITGAGAGDREPDAELPPPLSRERIANMHFFFSRDLPALRRCELGVAEIAGLGRAGCARAVPGAGRTTPRDFFDHLCVEALARVLGTEVVEFPGGHNGPTTHPAGFASRLGEVLRGT
ncbi:alpha/beta fold hydrolase [Sphaerisporangium fuscum]|uniref:alpha/beta fold hydrolase n=1 Tax=Sphaerisporangium fuscum TaxID=2835868 RepID=UPI001BDC5FCB|nr:alpha/beta hydrolase [Sphaerisporangium fuscum]